MNTLNFDNPEGVTFEVEPETRTIRGLALPYGDEAQSGGMRWTFAKGTLSWGKVTVLDGHDWSRAVGTATLEDTDAGLLMVAKIARGPRGDEVLSLAEDGVYDGLSIGLADDVKAIAKSGVQHVKSGTVREVSLTPIPAFSRASVTSVAASAAPNTQEVPVMGDENKTVEVEAPVSVSADDVRAIFSEEIAKAFNSNEKRPVVPAAPGTAQFSITEEPIYRFDGVTASSGHDLSADVIASLRGDVEAKGRVLGFMSEDFANPKALEFVSTTDVASVNPNVYRPDLFKDEPPAQPTPMYDTFHAGGLSSVTPFFYSQFKAATGLIGSHVPGTAPTAGTFQTEAGATITPEAVSGRLFLTREVIDQGGNPQVSGLIRAKFARAFREALEVKTAGVLHTGLASFADLATLTGTEDGAEIGAALKQGLVDLQFTPDGSRFRKFFAAKALYSELAAAEDTNGRPLFPILAASNADGTAANRLGNINVAGILLEPTWSTEMNYGTEVAPAVDDTSFYVDPEAVKVWNSGLASFDKVGETAAGWNIDVFAYVATHLYDARGVRIVEFTPDA